jgi:hypothetical protein
MPQMPVVAPRHDVYPPPQQLYPSDTVLFEQNQPVTPQFYTTQFQPQVMNEEPIEEVDFLYGGGVVEEQRVGDMYAHLSEPIYPTQQANPLLEHPKPIRQASMFTQEVDVSYNSPANTVIVVPKAEELNFPKGTKPSATAPTINRSYVQNDQYPSTISSKQVLPSYNDSKREKRPKSSGRCCFCCPSLTTCLCCGPVICCLVFLVILLGLGLTGFFLWPRVPTVTFLGIRQTQPVGLRGNTISGVWNVSVAVDSQNYIDWHFNSINAKLYDSVADKQIGNGSLSDYDLPKRTNTTVSLPVTLDYTTSGAGDAVAQHVSKCATGGSIDIRYNIEFDLKGLGWIYKPKVDQTTSVAC